MYILRVLSKYLSLISSTTKSIEKVLDFFYYYPGSLPFHIKCILTKIMKKLIKVLDNLQALKKKVEEGERKSIDFRKKFLKSFLFKIHTYIYLTNIIGSITKY